MPETDEEFVAGLMRLASNLDRGLFTERDFETEVKLRVLERFVGKQ